ncbi:hypothetical protein [Lentzea guizhouensis]|uniref:hypothetical protein n=1 Tax=Lentzea guizhouensis TaxID=1586287 RepID=UPI0012B6A030|nr:hypothetical protein [Lentzea guizhouensis]
MGRAWLAWAVRGLFVSLRSISLVDHLGTGVEPALAEILEFIAASRRLRLGLYRYPSLQVKKPRLRLDGLTWGAWAFVSLRSIRLAWRVREASRFGSLKLTRPSEGRSLASSNHPASACSRVNR